MDEVLSADAVQVATNTQRALQVDVRPSQDKGPRLPQSLGQRGCSTLRRRPARRMLNGRGSPHVIRYRDVGSVVVTGGGGERRIGAPTPALVLAVLLVQLNRWVRVERLIDVLRREHAAAHHESAVESQVCRLSSVLEPGRATGESPGLWLGGTGGSSLTAGPGDLTWSGPPARRARRLTRVPETGAPRLRMQRGRNWSCGAVASG